jgi:putative membrane protein
MSANHITITDQQPPAAAAMSEKAPTTSSSHTLNAGNATPGNISREATWRQHDVHAPSRQPTAHSLDLDDYFAGPRDVRRHSKYPYFMRLHGSVLPKMIIPLTFVGVWATVITCITQLKISPHSLGVNSILLTVLGFVVGLALSFRSTTAYERYNDGRRYWSQLSVTSRNLARLIWIHVEERHAESEELGKKDLLEKLSAINLINAFAVALKHRLRFEPATEYPDLEPLINHLTTMAGSADQAKLRKKTPTPWKA